MSKSHWTDLVTLLLIGGAYLLPEPYLSLIHI